MKAIGVGLLAIVAILGVSWIAQGNDFFLLKVFGPKYADTNRQIFEHGQSYVQGKVDYLSQLRLEYESAEPGSPHRHALRSMILTQANTVDRNQLPPDLQRFIGDLEVSR